MKTIKSITLAALCILTVETFAQAPDWADASKRKLRYSEREYLIGFASEANKNKEDEQAFLSRIEGYAKGQLIEYIQVKVQSEAISEEKEENSKVQRTFKSMYSASSNLNVTGLKIEKVYDKKGKIGYAIAFAKRFDLMNYYKSLIDAALKNASQKIEEAKLALGRNDSQHALKACLEANNYMPEIEQSQKILLAIAQGSASESEVQVEMAAKIRTSAEEIIRQAQRSSGNTIDEASFFIVRGLKLTAEKIENPILLTNFTYQDTKMASELSRRLTQSLTSKLVSEGGYSIETESKTGASSYVLAGTFWNEADDIKVIATLKDLNGKVMATAEAFIPQNWLQKSNVAYLPENFEEAYSKMRVFNKNEIIKGDLNIEVWTNKGDDNLLYTEGEKLKFFVRSNKESYLRLIYHLADGQSVLLLDNYYIAANMVNKIVEIPDEFECSEPFGIETLQINAQTEEFTKLLTKNQDGYNFISNDLEDLLINTRGFKKVESKEIQRAEKRLIFTTLPK